MKRMDHHECDDGDTVNDLTEYHEQEPQDVEDKAWRADETDESEFRDD